VPNSADSFTQAVLAIRGKACQKAVLFQQYRPAV